MNVMADRLELTVILILRHQNRTILTDNPDKLIIVSLIMCSAKHLSYCKYKRKLL